MSIGRVHVSNVNREGAQHEISLCAPHAIHKCIDPFQGVRDKGLIDVLGRKCYDGEVGGGGGCHASTHHPVI